MTPNTDTANTTDSGDIETTSTPAEPSTAEDETSTAEADSGSELAVFDAAGLDAAAVVYEAELIEEQPNEFRPLYLRPDLLDFDVPEDEPRYDLDNDPEFVESVRMWGVLEPVTVYPLSNGRYQVARGRRRVLAAQATGHTVPVAVQAPARADHSETMIQTLAAEVHTNDRRREYTDRERANRWAQMSLYGASVTRIARDTACKREEVKAALTAVDSPSAMDAVDSGQLTFEQAAVVARYEQAGDLDAVVRLMQAPTARFGTVAGEIAADREQIAEQLRESLPYAERGFSFVLREPGCSATELPDGEFLHHEELRNPDGGEVTAVQPSLWTVCLEVEPESVAVDAETGEPVEFAEIDWDTRHDRSAPAQEGLRHFDSIFLRDSWVPDFWLPLEHLGASGLIVYEEYAPGLIPDTDTPDTDREASDPEETGTEASESEEQRRADPSAAAETAEAARRAAEEQREKDRQKRRMVIALNIQGTVAKEERCAFVRRLLSRKTLPTGAAAFVAESLLIEPELVNRHLAQATALELLRFDDRESAQEWNATEASAGQSLVLVYGLVLGAHEARMDQSHWRADAGGWWGDGPGYRRYLLHLAGQGHTLTPVEQVTTGALELTDIDIDALRAEQKAAREEEKARVEEQKALTAAA
ncbi:ParB N-terminal domain-containing protein [Nocardia alni]|uniref:ParB N-terminal domain-containing protein n=1 Tax=Nocardia alni TaxID=2815723 RepID=UPI001C217B7C|nr:ParB N-terminal domain-containing protein [Nocardia alni]